MLNWLIDLHHITMSKAYNPNILVLVVDKKKQPMFGGGNRIKFIIKLIKQTPFKVWDFQVDKGRISFYVYEANMWRLRDWGVKYELEFYLYERPEVKGAKN